MGAVDPDNPWREPRPVSTEGPVQTLGIEIGLALPTGYHEFDLVCWEEGRRQLALGFVELDMRVEFGGRTYSFLLRVSGEHYAHPIDAKPRTFEVNYSAAKGFVFQLVKLNPRGTKRENILTMRPVAPSNPLTDEDHAAYMRLSEGLEE